MATLDRLLRDGAERYGPFRALRCHLEQKVKLREGENLRSVPNHRCLVAEGPAPQRFKFPPWKPERRVVPWSKWSEWQICLAFRRGTEAENNQSVIKQMLQAYSQFVFECEVSVSDWETVWLFEFCRTSTAAFTKNNNNKKTQQTNKQTNKQKNQNKTKQPKAKKQKQTTNKQTKPTN